MIDTGTEAGGSYEVSAKVFLPRNASGMVCAGTGNVLVQVADPSGMMNREQSGVEVVSTDGRQETTAKAEFRGYIRDERGQAYVRYSFHYAPEDGYPTRLRFTPSGSSIGYGDSTHTYKVIRSVVGSTELTLVPY